MAFIGIVIMGILFLILGGLLLFTIIMLVLGIIMKKHKKASKILLACSGIGLMVIVGALWCLLTPGLQRIDTPDGEVKVKYQYIRDFSKFERTHDIQGLRKLLEKCPDLVYYQDNNSFTLLEYGMFSANVEMMALAVEYGAVFDAPMVYGNKTRDTSSFAAFFGNLDYSAREEDMLHEAGVTTGDIIDTVEFMIEHGASLYYEATGHRMYNDFYEEAKNWVMLDGIFSAKDEELLALVEENMEGMEE